MTRAHFRLLGPCFKSGHGRQQFGAPKSRAQVPSYWCAQACGRPGRPINGGGPTPAFHTVRRSIGRPGVWEHGTAEAFPRPGLPPGPSTAVQRRRVITETTPQRLAPCGRTVSSDPAGADSCERAAALSSNPTLRRDPPDDGDRPTGLAPSTGSGPIQDGLGLAAEHRVSWALPNTTFPRRLSRDSVLGCSRFARSY
ncbi:hypothetical protein J6590_085688 [Homalodisca vitripennis]|nr:hypothetical protein J6590_085688 [Homalodisca vitripennis]